MLYDSSVVIEAAPGGWARSCSGTELRLHQLSPYIGKLKSTIAADLIERFTCRGETVLDCFCGSGTIPLECATRGRSVVASDVNPYGVTLTRGKLEAPSNVDIALSRLGDRLEGAGRRPSNSVSAAPEWVSKFFHPRTLNNVIRFADECIEKDDQFLLSCLLGVLHHQRPGFLSYPSSHLVPYLRDRKFPRDSWPDLYEERLVPPRLERKVRRALTGWPGYAANVHVSVSHQAVEDLAPTGLVDAVITSPPYMNALDYVRDNRLRMWFLDRSTADYSPEPTDASDQFDKLTVAFVVNALARLRAGGCCVLVVGETVRRKRKTQHPAERLLRQIIAEVPGVELETVIEDEIPDVRRTRREGAAIKRELILVLRVP